MFAELPLLGKLSQVFDNAAIDTRYCVRPADWYRQARSFSQRNAVASRFSAAREMGKGPGDIALLLAGKTVALDVVVLQPGSSVTTAGPRLRFDKVATRVMERLEAALGECVPEGITVLLTLAAPIRLASKTTVLLEEKIRGLLERRARRDEQETICGNRIRIRLTSNNSPRAQALIGFVHHADSDPNLLLDIARVA